MDKDNFSHQFSFKVLRNGIKYSNSIFTKPLFLQSKQIKAKGVPFQCSFSKMIHYRKLRSLFSFPTIYAKEITASKELTASHHIESQTPEYLKLSVITDADVEKYLSLETGYMRLKEMFSRDNQGKLSPELFLIKDITQKTFAFGGVFMSIFAARNTRETHIQQTKAVTFRTKMEASRRLHDRIWISSIKEGAKWAFRIASYALCFLTISQTIAVYRNKTSPIEYTVASAVTGALLKTNLGIRGMIGGGFVGTIIGVVAGIWFYSMLHVVNQTQEQRHYEQIVRKLEMSRDPSKEIEELRQMTPYLESA